MLGTTVPRSGRGGPDRSAEATVVVGGLMSLLPAGWLYILRKPDRTVRRAAAWRRARIVLTAHSAGGVLAGCI